MENVAKLEEAVLEENISLLKERNKLKEAKAETKGQIADLAFDGLSEEEFTKRKAEIEANYALAEAEYKKKVEQVVSKKEAHKAELIKIKSELKAKIQEIKQTEVAKESPDEIQRANEAYQAKYKKLTDEYNAKVTQLKSEISAISQQAKAEDKRLRAEFKLVKKTPMKRAEKSEKLESLKEEIFQKSGEADLKLLERNNELKATKAKYKKDVCDAKTERNLVTRRAKTMIILAKREAKAKMAPIKEQLSAERSNYGNVAPFKYRVGLGFRNWWERFSKSMVTSFTSWPGFGNWFIRNAVYLVIIVLVVVTAIVKPSWLNLSTIISIIKNSTFMLPLALGVAGCIVLTGTDLSLGRIFGLCALLAASLLGFASGTDLIFEWTRNMPWIWLVVVLLICMAVGGLCGGLNGFFVAKFSIHPFVVTLATQLIVYGIIVWYGGQFGVSTTFNMSTSDNVIPIAATWATFINSGIIIAGNTLSNYVWYSLILMVVVWFIWNKTKFGKAMFAVGCNPDAANVSGINVQRTILMTFVLAGICYGFYGFIYGPVIAPQLSTGDGGELDPITAAVIGGVSFTGGIGKISGVLLGCLFLKIIDSSLQAMGLPTEYVNMFKGLIILFAVSLDMKKYVAKK